MRRLNLPTSSGPVIPPAPARKWNHHLIEGFHVASAVVGHILGAGAALFGGFSLHHLLLAEGDPNMWDLVPWRYVVDTSDAVILITLTYLAVVAMIKASK